MALVTLNQGELGDYLFFDAHELTDTYISHRQTVLPQPWPIERYFPQDGFLLHDALWWPDFPRSARQLMTMYAETGWPSIDGVIAVQPEAASMLLDLTGSFSVDFQGQHRQITADNVYSEIERLRPQPTDASEQMLAHKQMLGLIGKSLIERLKTADRHALLDALKRLGEAILEAVHTPQDLASIVAGSLVDANLAGHDSHGVIRLTSYVAGVRSGQVRPAARPVVESLRTEPARR